MQIFFPVFFQDNFCISKGLRSEVERTLIIFFLYSHNSLPSKVLWKYEKNSFWGQGRGEWEDGFLKVILEEYTSHLQKFDLRTIILEVVNT